MASNTQALLMVLCGFGMASACPFSGMAMTYEDCLKQHTSAICNPTPASCISYAQVCSQKLTSLGFNDVHEALEVEQAALLKACAQTMCDNSIAPPPQNANMSWDCIPPPTNCTNTQTYMQLRTALKTCQMRAFLAISNKKKAAAANVTVRSNRKAAAEAAAACAKTIQCETDALDQRGTVAGRSLSCTTFFCVMEKDLPWVASCDQASMCKNFAVTAPIGTRVKTDPCVLASCEERPKVPSIVAFSFAASVESFFRSALNAAMNARLSGQWGPIFPNMHIQARVASP